MWCEGSMDAWWGNCDPTALTSHPGSVPRAFGYAGPNPSFHLWLTLTFCSMGFLSLPDLSNYWLSTLTATLDFVLLLLLLLNYMWYLTNVPPSQQLLFFCRRYENNMRSCIKRYPNRLRASEGSCLALIKIKTHDFP